MSSLPDFGYLMDGCGGMISGDDAALLYTSASWMEPKTIVEIGGCTGCSTSVLAKVAQENGGHLYTIECSPQERWHKNLERIGLTQYVTMIQAFSPWLTDEQLTLIPKPIDYLLIDGEHKTKWCIADYQYWQKFVRPEGRIAFHDWCGANGVGAEIRRAVEIILETDALTEVARVGTSNRGLIVFTKNFA